MKNLENYECENQMSLFDYIADKPTKYAPNLNAVDGICEFDKTKMCDRYGEGYRDVKPHKHYACTGCCRYCDAYQTRCGWECQRER